MKDICHASHCPWARHDGYTCRCTMPVCQSDEKRNSAPVSAAMDDPMPCYTCVSFRGGECRVICRRYKRWVSARWRAVVEILRRAK